MSSQVQPVESSLGHLAQEGKFLTFSLANEEYGLEILKVREIIGFIDVTAVPQTPDHVKGVINLRGQVIPVVDLRANFAMETTETTDQTCIIVDCVSEVLDIAAEQIEDAPRFGTSVDTNFILGMAKIGDSVKILLDIDQVLNRETINDLAETLIRRYPATGIERL